MNKKALYYALIYCALVIAFKLFILFGGYSLTRYGFFYSHITTVFFILPFYVLAVRSVRDKDYNGTIGGREAMRITLTLFAVSAIVLSIYNYFEFEYSGRALAVEYYNGEQFLDFLKKHPQIKADQYDKIIHEQVSNAESSSFKATTGKLFSMMLIGLSGAFITSAIMKRRTA